MNEAFEIVTVWVATYHDDVAGENSFDVFDSLKTAKSFTNKLKAERVISNVVIDQRRVLDEHFK